MGQQWLLWHIGSSSHVENWLFPRKQSESWRWWWASSTSQPQPQLTASLVLMWICRQFMKPTIRIYYSCFLSQTNYPFYYFLYIRPHIQQLWKESFSLKILMNCIFINNIKNSSNLLVFKLSQKNKNKKQILWKSHR